MIIGSLVILLFVLIGSVFALAIPILIGVFVYRDAEKRRDCNPWLWALVAALVPSCVGVIIYLIIRNDYPLKTSPNVQSPNPNEYYQENYDNVAKDRNTPMPTWVKAIIIIGAVIVGICLLAIVGAVIHNIFGIGSMGYYSDPFQF